VFDKLVYTMGFNRDFFEIQITIKMAYTPVVCGALNIFLGRMLDLE